MKCRPVLLFGLLAAIAAAPVSAADPSLADQVTIGKLVAGQIKPDEPPVGFGDAWILAVEFSRPIVAYSVLAYGQTTRSASPHSTDQARLYANHQYKRVWFSEADIKANLERSYRP